MSNEPSDFDRLVGPDRRRMPTPRGLAGVVTVIALGVVIGLVVLYAGAAMPLLILFSLSRQPLGAIVSSEVVAVEIIRTLVGSIGLVAAVPITTWLAAREAAAEGSL